MSGSWKKGKRSNLPVGYYNYHNRYGTNNRGGYPYEWTAPKRSGAMGRAPWKWLWQSAASLCLFALVLTVFQSGHGTAQVWQDNIRAWCTVDSDLTPVMKLAGGIGLTGDPFDRAGYAVVQANAAARIQEEMVIPVAGKVVSKFGWQPGLSGESFNQGIVIETDPEETVKAAYGGTVLVVQPAEGGLYTVMLAHSNGLVTTYGNCSEVLVKPDQMVTKGESIAVTGKTEVEKGRLYFETKHLGEPVDPLSLLSEREV